MAIKRKRAGNKEKAGKTPVSGNQQETDIKHEGEEEVFVGDVEEVGHRAKTDEGKVMQLRFQVAGVTKPLMSVKRVVEKGNRVVFGKGPGESYIENEATGERMAMRRKNGTYVVDVEYEASGGMGFARQD